jgi:hypothetical protein
VPYKGDLAFYFMSLTNKFISKTAKCHANYFYAKLVPFKQRQNNYFSEESNIIGCGLRKFIFGQISVDYWISIRLNEV